MQCDLCHRWAHIGCVGVTKAAYKLAGKLEGFQWLCPSCLDDWRSTKPLVLDLASEIKILQLEASKVPVLENTLRELQSTVEKLSQVIDFMSSDSPSVSLPAWPVNINPCIKESPNRFALLQDPDDSSGKAATTIDHPIPPKDSLLFPLIHLIHPLFTAHRTLIPSQSPPVPVPMVLIQPTHNHSISKLRPILAITPNPPLIKQQFIYEIFILKIADKGIDLEGCTLGDSTLGVGSRKSIKVTYDSLDRCNLLDRELKSNPDLPWFLSLHPPRRPHRGPQYRNKLNSHSQLNVPPLPSNQQPFLSKRPPPTPVMDILLPPLRNRPPIFHTPPNMQPTITSQIPTKSINLLKVVKSPTPYKIPPLMSLQLPPLAAQTCPPHHTNQQIQIALR